MTTNQLIAMLFPVGTAVAAAVFAYGVMKWVNWRYRADLAREARPITEDEAYEMLSEADTLIRKAQRSLHRAH